MKKIIAAVALCYCLYFTPTYAQQVIPAKEIAVSKLQKKIGRNIQLVDVRTAKEFKEGHIGNAINIEYDAPDFAQRIQQLNKNKRVYLYCRTGKRSAKAAQKMDSLGFRKLYVLPTGIAGWNKETKE
jgi:rhodanese-related sulfurtransferase